MRIERTNKLPCDLYKDFEVAPNIMWFVVYNDNNEWMSYAGIQLNWYGCVSVYMGPSFVREEFRGKGLQRKMMQFRENWAKENGYSVLTTCAYEDNIYSRRNIEAEGYKEDSRNGKEIWYTKRIKEKYKEEIK